MSHIGLNSVNGNQPRLLVYKSLSSCKQLREHNHRVVGLCFDICTLQELPTGKQEITCCIFFGFHFTTVFKKFSGFYLMSGICRQPQKKQNIKQKLTSAEVKLLYACSSAVDCDLVTSYRCLSCTSSKANNSSLSLSTATVK